MHWPNKQLSPFVQALPSLQGVPSGLAEQLTWVVVVVEVVDVVVTLLEGAVVVVDVVGGAPQSGGVAATLALHDAPSLSRWSRQAERHARPGFRLGQACLQSCSRSANNFLQARGHGAASAD